MMACSGVFVTVTSSYLFSLCNLCSPGGRGIPDVSAQALAYKIVINQGPQTYHGTSCPTPVRLPLLPSPLRTCLTTDM